MKLESIKVDPTKIEAGEWVDNIPEFDNIRLRVRGINNADYLRLENKLFAALPRAKRLDLLTAQQEMRPRLLLETVLLDWQNIDEGPYSKELATKYLSEPAFRRFRDAVYYAALTVGEAVAEELKDDSKN